MRGGPPHDDLDPSAAGWSEITEPSGTSTAPAGERTRRPDDPLRYSLERVLGRGGMGTVHSVRDGWLDRHVALKEAARDHPALARRLEREAKILAKLDHPGIVPLFDAGHLGEGRPFYTMPRLEGQTLADAIAEGGANGESPRVAAEARLGHLRAVLVVCEAVAHAHDRGIVHRDLKPANVMLGERGQTVVLDWGLAREHGDETLAGIESFDPLDTDEERRGAGSRSGGARENGDLTRRGSVVGTPRYMAPEQLLGVAVDPRCDVWSLGALLQAVLLGEPPAADLPAKKASAEALRRRAQRRVPFPIPKALAAIAARALEADPEARYPNAGAMAADLARFIDGRWVDAHDYSGMEVVRTFVRRHRATVAATSIGALSLLGFGGASFWQTERERARAVEAEQVALEALERSTRAETQTRDALERAAQALHTSQVGAAQLAARRGARPEAELLAASALTMAESPKARGVLAGFDVDERPRLSSTTPISLADCEQADLDHSGRHLVCATASGAAIYDTRTGEQLDHIDARPVDNEMAQFAGPEHSRLVLGLGDRIEVFDLAGQSLAALPSTFGPAFNASESAGATLIATGGGVVRLDAGTGEYEMLDACGGKASGWTKRIAADAHSGRWVGFCADGRIERWADANHRVGVDAFQSETMNSLHISPGGEEYWVGSRGGLVLGYDLQTGAATRRFETGVGRVSRMVTSPDGLMMAVVGERRGVALVNLRTGALLWRLPAQQVRDVAFVGRGQLLVAGEALEVWSLPDSLGPRRFVGDAGLSSIALSHDGRQVAAVDGAGYLWVWSRDDGRVLNRQRWQSRVAKDLAYSRDDETLAVVAMLGGIQRISTDDWSADPLPTGAHRRVDWLGDIIVAQGYGRAPSVVRDGRVGYASGDQELDWVDAHVSPDQQTMVMVERRQGTVRLTERSMIDDRDEKDAFPGREVWTEPGAFAVDVTDGAGRIMVASRHHVQLIDGQGRALRRFDADGHTLTAGALDPRGRWVAAGTLAGRVLVWSTADGTLVAETHGHLERISSLAFDGDGQTLASGSWDGSVSMWDLEALELDAQALLEDLSAAWGMGVEDVSIAQIE